MGLRCWTSKASFYVNDFLFILVSCDYLQSPFFHSIFFVRYFRNAFLFNVFPQQQKMVFNLFKNVWFLFDCCFGLISKVFIYNLIPSTSTKHQHAAFKSTNKNNNIELSIFWTNMNTYFILFLSIKNEKKKTNRNTICSNQRFFLFDIFIFLLLLLQIISYLKTYNVVLCCVLNIFLSFFLAIVYAGICYRHSQTPFSQSFSCFGFEVSYRHL